MSSNNNATSNKRDFVLCAELKDHVDQVRSVAPFPLIDGGVLTGSLDTTIKVWQLKKNLPQEEEQKQAVQEDNIMSDASEQQQQQVKKTPTSRYACMATLVGHQYFVSDIAFIAPNQKNANNGQIVSVSHDKSIIFWNPSTCAVEHQIQGAHESAITSVALDANNSDRLITASWDKTAKIWQNRACAHTLQGHTTNVLCVLSLSNGYIVTGCGDGTVKIWDGETGGEIKNIVASTTCVRGLAELPGVGFLTVANDGNLKTWTLQGDCVHEIPAHSNLVYSVIVTPSGEIVTASEDRTVKVWRDGNLVQTIEHPACVWKVAVLSNGDLVSACADCVARVFTRAEDRQAEPAIIQNFNDVVANSKVKKSGVDSGSLPSAVVLQQPGKKHGEVKLVNNNGSPEAWSWNAQLSKWEKMGDVVDGPGVGGGFSGKVYYEGEMYDYVFDIELEQPGAGTRKYKLPFNRGGNPFEAAQDFIWKHEMPQYYLDQIAQFIVQNSDQQGGGGGGGSTMEVDTDPLTGYQSYVPNPNSGAKTTKTELSEWEKEQLKLQKEEEEKDRQKRIVHFPSNAIMFDQANTDGIVKKIKEFNEALTRTNPELALSSDAEWKLFSDWIDSLKSLNYSKISTAHLQILDNKLLKWPHKQLFPVIDLLRLVILTPPGAQYYAQEYSNKGRDIMKELLALIEQNRSDNVLVMLFMRFAANMFIHDAAIALRHASELLNIVLSFSKTDNKNIQLSAGTLVLNLCVHYRGKHDSSIQESLLTCLSNMLSVAIDHTLIYRLLIAAGTLLDGSSFELRQQAAEKYKIAEYAQQHTSSPTPQVHGAAFRLKLLFERH